MKTKISYLLCRIGLVGVFSVMATLVPARQAPASICYEDQQCFNSCWISCEDLVWYSWDAYDQCMGQCTPSCITCT
jgi:hypothetical protein